MTIRTVRPDAQIKKLATELGRGWVVADGVEPWLRRHATRLTNLVKLEGWSWDDVGRAMTAAGITYATGHPWTGGLLARKASKARAQVRAHEQKRRQRAGGKSTPEAPKPATTGVFVGTFQEPPCIATKPSHPVPTEADPPRRTFGLACPRGWTPPPASPPTEPNAPTPAATPRVDADAVLARFMGRPYPSTPTKGER